MILASASPRRVEILRNAGYTFEVLLPNIDETLPADVPLVDSLPALALCKAENVRDTFPSDISTVVVAADTIVLIDGKVLGKPGSATEAGEMLRTLSGRMHTVYTAYALLSGRTKQSGLVQTKVFFRDLTDAEIADYIASGEPFDKAGGYGIQGIGSKFVDSIEGDFYTVMGLPICKLSRLLDLELFT